MDENRHPISTNLYRLRNLQKDIEDVKDSFRRTISEETDAKAYIYTFCEHIAELFAKMSNIRMSYVVYGFKQPHTEWEGILALDIWYQFLYRAIDEQYPFNDEYLDMNPMSVTKDENGTSYIWDDDLWDELKRNAKSIHDQRSDYVTPRGVLGKIHDIVYKHDAKDVVCDYSNGDFDWFHQNGKVYSEANKSDFTKYTNLHLGRAYEVMSPQDYKEFIDTDATVKPSGVDLGIGKKQRMLELGFDALEDAFSVIKNEKIFNIYNSSTNAIEEFNPEHII